MGWHYFWKKGVLFMQTTKNNHVVVTLLPQIYRVTLSLARLVEQMMVETGQLPPERRRVLNRRDLRRDVVKGLQKEIDVVECETAETDVDDV